VLVDWLSAERPGAVVRRTLLQPIAREGRLPSLEPLTAYERYIVAAGLTVVHAEDFSRAAARTWTVVGGRLARRLMRDGEARRFLFSAANPDRAFGFSLLRIPVALRTGAMRLCLLVATRPTA
jgi:tocopherol O-methyltransferase